MTDKIQTVNPDLVPKRKLYTGAEIPAIGLGTFGSDHVTHDEVAEAVKIAIRMGYRHIDCASVYGNEKQIGQAIKEIIAEGVVTREELWITSKLWNDMHSEGDVVKSFNQSLEDLQLDYLDLYLVHWPFPNYHAPGCDIDARSEDSIPYSHEGFMRTWRDLETFYKEGRAKHIGTSNVTIPKLKLILRDCEVKPAVNEMELHPHFQQPEFYNFVVENGIVPIGYSPIGSPARPVRDTTPEDTVDTQDPVVLKIAERLNVHPAVVCLKWAVQRGQVPIPFSSNPRNIFSNLQAIVSNPITEDEMAELSKVDKECRLIKGHVFLWEGANDWKDLWDLEGEIIK